MNVVLKMMDFALKLGTIWADETEVTVPSPANITANYSSSDNVPF